MDDFSDDTPDSIRNLQRGLERRRSMVASQEDIAGSPESVDGEWSEWMCGECGIFMKPDRDRCRRCGLDRIFSP